MSQAALARSGRVKNRVSIGMLSLGCPKTLVDSELILGVLDPHRYRVARQIGDCDVALLNTCAFIEEAKQESIDYILKLAELKKEGRIKAIIVLGCLVQRYHKELEHALSEVDAFVGTGEYNALNGVLDQVVQKRRISQVGPSPGFLYTADMSRVPLTPLHTRYIKISEGCDHVCTFCTIPTFRGRHRSREIEDVVKEATQLVRDGARELVLTGQDTTYFGRDTRGAFLLPELLRELDRISGLVWIRILYAYPSCVNEDLIETIARQPKVCHYLDMPLQHISDRILRSMKRGMNQQSTRTLIRKLRDRIPDLAIRTTFIVGFPGETEDDFKELLDFMEEARFERLGLFMYSAEEHSGSAGYDGQVATAVKRKRFDEGMQLQQKISVGNNKRLIGSKLSILIEGKDGKHPHRYVGRSYQDAPEVDGSVYVDTPQDVRLSPGQFVSAVVEAAHEYDLSARWVQKESA